MKVSRAEKIRRRAIKAGLRQTRRLHHGLSREEILGLKIQVLPAALRISMAAIGTTALVCAFLGWPSLGIEFRIPEGISGICLMAFSLFGVRRTLSEVGERLGDGLLDVLIDSITNAIDL